MSCKAACASNCAAIRLKSVVPPPTLANMVEVAGAGDNR
ncbi:Uncharacterised protein [Vibrio cholerae]|nr:Uncharacterised protein [Vibrio cholerae]